MGPYGPSYSAFDLHRPEVLLAGQKGFTGSKLGVNPESFRSQVEAASAWSSELEFRQLRLMAYEQLSKLQDHAVQ